MLQRLHYLKTSLRGEAANTIKSIELCASNFKTAWELIQKRFRNDRLIINNHIKAVVDFPRLDKESAKGLRTLHSNLNEHLRALDNLNQPTNQWGSLLIYLISGKLDSFTSKEWESSIQSKQYPSFDQFMEFLEQRCDTLEAMELTRTHSKPNDKQKVVSAFKTPSSASQPANRAPNSYHKSNFIATQRNPSSQEHHPTCFKCLGHHHLYFCHEFKNLTIEDRIDFIKKNSICENCLRSANHSAKTCRAKPCQKCPERHNTLLHDNSQDKEKSSPLAQPAFQCNASMFKPTKFRNSTILLSTAIINIMDKNGNKHCARALLDSGSESCFITESLAKFLGLRNVTVPLTVTGIAAMSNKVSKITSATIQSRLSKFSDAVDFIVLPKIANDIPSTAINVEKLNIPKSINLADPSFGKPGKIDLLLGSTIFWKVLSGEQLKINEGSPMLQNTQFGWIIAGECVKGDNQDSDSKTFNSVSCVTQINDEDLQQFWKIEECVYDNCDDSDNYCEEHFKKTYSRTSDGHFVVKLPFRNNGEEMLGNTKQIALKRFSQLERRLEKNPDLKAYYVDFMTEYLNLNDMELAPPTTSHLIFHLPHHPVFKLDSTTTKVRVVFNASQRPSNNCGFALNEALLPGPVIQQDLTSIVLRFRSKPIALTADIAKMHRQVKLDPSQKDLHRIFWRSSPTEPLREYRLTTLTYGTSPGSFLATRCLLELAELEASSLPRASEILKNDFYMDDLLTCFDTPAEAQVVQKELDLLLKRGGFELRKWNSNCPQLTKFDQTPSRLINAFTEIPSSSRSIKTLGVHWNPQNDSFSYKVNEYVEQSSITKRHVLSEISKIFDPLGFIGPVTFTAKLLMQKLWSLKSTWDEVLSDELKKYWLQFRRELMVLNELEIPRSVVPFVIPHLLEMHGFCDASEGGFGAVIYVTSFNNNTAEYCVRMLCSKSRVAPIKKPKNEGGEITIAKLELCGAQLLSRLVHKVRKFSNLNFENIYLWCDSMVTLCWINSSPEKWNRFVSNRVREIQAITQNCVWGYVPTKENPADLLSRGLGPIALSTSKMWWNGPEWIQEPKSQWPSSLPPPSYMEENTVSTNISVRLPCLIDIAKFSKLSKLKRVMAYVFRVLFNLRNHKNKKSGALTADELQESLTYIIKSEQQHYFAEEYKLLEEGKPVKRSSSLITLNPFIDSLGLLRVGGRLQRSEISYDAKHPIIIPYKSHLSYLIAEQEHIRCMHGGPSLLLASIRQRYWPIKGKHLVRKVVHSCKPCFMVRPIQASQLMGQLPAARLKPNSVFNHVGIDYCGPIYIKNASSGRNTKLVKAYISIFVCLSTKAVHVELVGDLTSSAFIAALKRFVSRRGLCNHIYSDNGSNFIGANRELREIYNLLNSNETLNQILDYLSSVNIKWHSIPPRAPNFGGLWEAAVKSLKYHLRRVLGNQTYNYEQTYTYLAMVESCLNSRPILPMSSSPDDLLPLTPGHFLIGRPLIMLPAEDSSSIPMNRLTHWRQLQKMANDFWARWSKDYLNTLQQRPKWFQTSQPLQEGDLVVLKEDHLPATYWRMARIITLHPGPDNLPRVATLRTSNGEVTRAIAKICPLPSNDPPSGGEDVASSEEQFKAPALPTPLLANPTSPNPRPRSL